MTIHTTAGRQRGMGERSGRGRGLMCRGRVGRRLGGRVLLGLVAASALTAGGLACGGVTDEGTLPPEIPDPASLHTADGALARYRGALADFPSTLDAIVLVSGVLTDELADLPAPPNVGSSYTGIDSRQDLTSGFDGIYSGLHHLRGQAREARGFLGAYAPGVSSALAGHLYAMEGYADVFLADLFCSGIPLSTVDFNADYTLAAGSSTAEVYDHAIALFDSALALVSDSSARFQPLAAIGRGRALLARGRYAEAAAAVAGVPDGYRYQIVVPTTGSVVTGGGTKIVSFGPTLLQRFGSSADSLGYWIVAATPSMGDHEGFNGLDYRSSGDPRTPATARPGTDPFGNTMYFPANYPLTGDVPLTVADAVEARLIEAEAALQAGDVSTWLAILNRLRTTGPVTVPPDTIADTLGVSGCGSGLPTCGHSPGGDDPVEFGQPVGGFSVPAGYDLVSVDTTYPAPPGVGNSGGLCDHRSWYRPCYQGDSMVVYVYVHPASTALGVGTGGVAGLDALADPGTPAGRVALLFRERGFWLYLTGHRQGDLRRLVRQPEYLRSPGAVYPSGLYRGGSGTYGNEVVAPVPASEQESNPKYTGCIHRDP